MRVISKSRLQQFWVTPGREDAEGPLRAWYTQVKKITVNDGQQNEIRLDESSP